MQRFWHQFIPKLFVCLKEKYTLAHLKSDFLSGITVAVLALPLSMAIGIASGVAPERGLFTAIIGGFLISFLGGSRVQIGGPTAAFVVVVYGIVQRQSYEGLVIATIMAGVMLVLIGLSRLGAFIKYLPYPLITGFTTGIAVILMSSQIKDFFGLSVASVPSDFIEKWQVYFHAFPSFDPTTLVVAASTLGLILLIRRFFPSIPWALGSIALVSLVCYFFNIPVETIKDRFGSIPSNLPAPAFPNFDWSFETVRRLFPDALAIALLAGIESLVSAVIADGMTGHRHKSNCELVAQGMANIGSALFGGIPATAALARTATNIKSGAKTPISGMIHAVILLLILLLFSPFVASIPLAALSAVLMMVAWNMSEVHHFVHLFRAPLGDICILLCAFLLTVFVDITAAVEAGVILAAFLFMKRMSGVSNSVSMSKLFDEPSEEFPEKRDPDAISKKIVPPHVEVYEINGPFFFGVTDRLKDLLHNLEKAPYVFILRMRKVPMLDASGMKALKDFYHKCHKDHTVLILSGVHAGLTKYLSKFGLETLIGENNIFPHIDHALQHAKNLVDQRVNASTARKTLRTEIPLSQ